MKIYYFNNSIDMSIYEIYWIGKYNPKYNKADNHKEECNNLILSECVPNKTISISDMAHSGVLEFDFDKSNLEKVISTKKIDLYSMKGYDIFDEKHTLASRKTTVS